jgi:apolipoprotein D and lipocalin family protein
MKYNVLPILLLVLSIAGISSCTPRQPLETVSQVDLQKYAGKWYEIASVPIVFTKRCHCTTATYTLHPKGYVVVENRCNRKSPDGKPSYIKGKAFVTKNSGNARLKVQFFPPLKGKYWIIDLAPDYSYAVVSEPGRNNLWILSRTPQMDPAVYDAITGRLKKNGFDLAKLKITDQGCS